MMEIIGFSQAMRLGQEFVVHPGRSTENRGIMVQGRYVDRCAVPKDWHCYEVLSDERDITEPVAITEDRGQIPHYGTFLTKRKLNFRPAMLSKHPGFHTYCSLRGENGYKYV